MQSVDSFLPSSIIQQNIEDPYDNRNIFEYHSQNTIVPGNNASIFYYVSEALNLPSLNSGLLSVDIGLYLNPNVLLI